MPVWKLTVQGLTAIGLCVALLWTCLLAERITVQRTRIEAARLVRDLRELQRQAQPVRVSTPVRPVRRPAHPVLG